MDLEAWLGQPLAAVFDLVAAPSRLSSWLPEVAAVEVDAGQVAGVGAGFGLRLRRAGGEMAGAGELIAYEPPWCVAYRLTFGPDTYVLRLTCLAAGGGTRVRVRQVAGLAPLAVDLPAVGAAGRAVSGEEQGGMVGG